MTDKPQTTKGPFADGMMKAASMLDVTNQDILLATGEISTKVIRDVRAVLAWKKRQIEREAENDNGYGF